MSTRHITLVICSLIFFALSGCQPDAQLNVNEALEVELTFERPTYVAPDRGNSILLSKINSLIEITSEWHPNRNCEKKDREILEQSSDQVKYIRTLPAGYQNGWGQGDAFASERKRLFNLGYFEESELIIEELVAGLPQSHLMSNGMMRSMKSSLAAWRENYFAALHWKRTAEEPISIYRRHVKYNPPYGGYLWIPGHRYMAFLDGLTAAEIAQMRGEYGKAEALYRKVLGTGGAHARQLPNSLVRSRLAENLVSQGQLLEAEVEIREAIKRSYVDRAPIRAILVSTLAIVLYEQGRFAETEQFAEASIRLFESECVPHRTFYFARARNILGKSLVTQDRMDEARVQFNLIEKEHGIAYPDSFSRLFNGNLDWGLALVESGNQIRGLEQIQHAYNQLNEGYVPDSLEVAIARGYLGIALMANQEWARAEDAFEAIVPTLRESYQHLLQTSQNSLKEQRIRRVFEGYLELLAFDPSTKLATLSPRRISTMFEFADLARSGKVHQSVAAAITRTVSDPELSDLIRREQDVGQSIEAWQSLIAQLTSRRGSEDEKLLTQVRTDLETMKATLVAIRAEVEKRFPKYAERLNVRAGTILDVKRSLRPDEALIATYLGPRQSYVWAVPKQGEVAFAVLPHGKAEFSERVSHLREALVPDVYTLDEIPPFDVDAAYDLYLLLLDPVKQGWANAEELVVVSHGALGQLPLGVLPMQLVLDSVSCHGVQTLNAPLSDAKHSTRALQRSNNNEASRTDNSCRENAGDSTTSANVDRGRSTGILFFEYRQVEWLARSHAISVIPSISTFREQRASQSVASATRPFIGYGDPLFNPEDAPAEEQLLVKTDHASLVSRGVQFRSSVVTRSMASATLEHLPRLPETADELIAIAESLGANPDTDVFLGLEASEQNIYGQSLEQYRVIAFATHGLVPGDLNGLQQPALAFTHPALTNSAEDGLMKLDEVLQLKLNAGWVILSACNTGAADGAGSEAISGLGRAFFYAGAKSLLVTHWPVETTSAKALTTKIFEVQAKFPAISRSTALRRARLAVMDGPGYTDDRGRELFYYAHPIFWAPFALVGGSG